MAAHVIAVPCYNEASRFDLAYWRGITQTPGTQWIFVDDGSTDATRLLLDELSALGNCSALSLERNQGKAEAVRLGLLHAMEEFPEASSVGFMDADGAISPSDLTRLMELQEQKSMAEGYVATWSSRVALAGRNVVRSTSRHYIGRVVATTVSLGYGVIPYDTQAGFKLFSATPDFAAILSSPFSTRWLFEIEMLNRWERAYGMPMRIWEEPLTSWRDVPGSRIRGKEIARVVREVAEIKRQQRQLRTVRR